MVYCDKSALLNPETVNVALVQSRWPAPKLGRSLRGYASRFERLAAAKEPTRPGLLGILLGAAAQGSWGGREVLWPLWVDEAMHRARCMIDLTSRLEHQMMRRGNLARTWSASCLGKATALAGSFAELRIVDDEEVLACSGLLGEIAAGLLDLFKVPDRDPEARIVLDDLALAAYERRALILATSALIMHTAANAMDTGCAPAISVKLAAQRGGQWRLAVTENDAYADGDARECDDIVDGLTDLLAGGTLRRFHRMREFVTEIDFSGREARRPSVPPTTSQVNRALASTPA